MTERKGDWIITFSGQKFYPLDPWASEVHPVDIAHSLSLQCRWTGHTAFHYSVAQHCVLGAAALGKLHGPEIQLAFLLHDAGEAYMADVARPIKRAPQMAFYKGHEAQLLEVIHQRFGLQPAHLLIAYNVIHVMDNAMLAAEAEVFFPSEHHWRSWETSEVKAGVTILESAPRVWEAHYFGALHTLLRGEPFKLRQRMV